MSEMSPTKVARALVEYNRWRRGGSKAPDPEALGRAIDAAARIALRHGAAMDALRSIAAMPRRSREQKTAAACLALLDELP